MIFAADDTIILPRLCRYDAAMMMPIMILAPIDAAIASFRHAILFCYVIFRHYAIRHSLCC